MLNFNPWDLRRWLFTGLQPMRVERECCGEASASNPSPTRPLCSPSPSPGSTLTPFICCSWFIRRASTGGRLHRKAVVLRGRSPLATNALPKCGRTQLTGCLGCGPATWVKSDRWLLAGRAGTDLFSSDYCCSLARGNAPSLELLRLSRIIPECHSALKGAVKKMTQEFVKKLMLPLIPCSPLGLSGRRLRKRQREGRN